MDSGFSVKSRMIEKLRPTVKCVEEGGDGQVVEIQGRGGQRYQQSKQAATRW